MNVLKEEKNDLRKKYLSLRRNIDINEKKKYDNELCRRFMTLVSYRYSDVLLFYAPLRDEADVLPIADRALFNGKTVAFPRCDVDSSTMTFHIVKSLNDLETGSFGIMEPSPELPVFEPSYSLHKRCICLVPALLFDTEGFRLGYGKGYYDRFLPEFYGSKIGVCYSSFVVNRVPRGRYDTAVDFIMTEKGAKLPK